MKHCCVFICFPKKILSQTVSVHVLFSGRCLGRLWESLWSVFSALRDRRFPPIQAREIPYLECTVSLLTDYESASSYLDWEIGKHGMILEFTDPESVRRSATYLPEVAAQEGWTKVETVDSLVRKAGYMGPLTESMRRKFRITRYQSSLCTMHYSEYAAYVKRIRGTTPLLTVKCWWAPMPCVTNLFPSSDWKRVWRRGPVSWWYQSIVNASLAFWGCKFTCTFASNSEPLIDGLGIFCRAVSPVSSQMAIWFSQV